MSVTPAPAPALPAETTQRRSFGAAFWPLCTIEMFERLAYYGVRTVVPIFIMQADDPGGLHLTAQHKGQIYLWWAIFQSVLPMFTGGYADRYGYKRTLVFALSLMTLGYAMMGFSREYWSFFTSVMVMASGTAFFKPSLQGSLAQNMDKSNSSLGWGIFYWIVNVGAFIAPFLMKPILGDHSAAEWRNVFLASAGFSALNLLLLFTFKDVPSGAEKRDGPVRVFVRTIANLADLRLVAFLLIMSGFWMMMYQLWDLQPNFINDWVDSRPMAQQLKVLPPLLYDNLTEDSASGRRVPQQLLLNLNAGLIILGVIPVSWVVRRMRTLSSMLIGMIVATIGVVVAGFTGDAWVLLLGIVFFSLGEMLTGPKKNEYLGLIAPPGKKGLYLGYVNIPVGLGAGIGAEIAGRVYGQFGEKATLALKYLAQHTPLGVGKGWDGNVSTLESTLGVKRTEAMVRLQEALGLDATAATQLLWNTYSPQYAVWLPFAAIGVVSAIALAIFGQKAKKWADMNA